MCVKVDGAASQRMAQVTVNLMTGENITFAFAMFSSYTLAVVREGDLPVIIPPWTLEPVKLQPFEPARPYFFLVRKPEEAVWRSLYYVIRKPANLKHSNVTDMPAQPAPPLHVSTPATSCNGPTCSGSTTSSSLCPPTHFSRLFQMRVMQWNIYIMNNRNTVSFPVETITDGDLRCSHCGDATRSNIIHFLTWWGYPGATGWFYPLDNEYLCKVATDESTPAVFAVLPQYAKIVPGQEGVVTYPSAEYVEVYYITSTVDRCALIYYTEYNSDHKNSTPFLIPQMCVKDIEKDIKNGTAPFTPLQATYDAGNKVCDDHIDGHCSIDPSTNLDPTTGEQKVCAVPSTG
jgi:hypothetical protein